MIHAQMFPMLVWLVSRVRIVPCGVAHRMAKMIYLVKLSTVWACTAIRELDPLGVEVWARESAGVGMWDERRRSGRTEGRPVSSPQLTGGIQRKSGDAQDVARPLLQAVEALEKARWTVRTSGLGLEGCHFSGASGIIGRGELYSPQRKAGRSPRR